MKQEDIDNWFSYHIPTPEQAIIYNELRNQAHEFAELFNRCVPDCADKTAAMRHLRETVMSMNLAIACNWTEPGKTLQFIPKDSAPAQVQTEK